MKKRLLTKWLVLLSFLCGTMTNTVSAAGYDAAYPAAVSMEAPGENSSLSEASGSEEVKESAKDEQSGVLSEDTSQPVTDTETADTEINGPETAEGEITEDSTAENGAQPEFDGETAEDLFGAVDRQK